MVLAARFILIDIAQSAGATTGKVQSTQLGRVRANPVGRQFCNRARHGRVNVARPNHMLDPNGVKRRISRDVLRQLTFNLDATKIDSGRLKI